MDLSRPIRAALYTRVSTDKQADHGVSLGTQEEQLRAYCKGVYNLTDDDMVTFEDAGYSGKNMDRPKFQEMMSQIRAGAFTHLVVWKIDRVSRNLLDFSMMYKELKSLGVTFVSKNEQFDTSTAMGEAMLKIILIFAELERNMTSERVYAIMANMAKNGRWNGGRVPFGYSYRTECDGEVQIFDIVESEAKIVREVFDLYEDERSIVRVAKIMNERGYTSRDGCEFSPVTVQHFLRSVFYVGDYRWNMLNEGDRQQPKPESEWITAVDHHAPIISREQFNRVQAILDGNKRIRKDFAVNASKRHIHIFGGLLFCKNCGRQLNNSVAAKKSGGWQYSYYPCPTRTRHRNLCNGKSISDPVIGGIVFNLILNMLNAQKDFRNIHSPEELMQRLLYGDDFKEMSSIDRDGLNTLYNILSSGKIQTAIYGKDVAVTKRKEVQVDPEIVRLRKEKEKYERALDRLMNAYLMSDSPISETEFITRKMDLEAKLADTKSSLGMAQSEEAQMALSDDEFIVKASEFVIGQKIANRNYIYYRRLAESVDPVVLKTFVCSIIDHIDIWFGKPRTIIFRNGLSLTFRYQWETETPTA